MGNQEESHIFFWGGGEARGGKKKFVFGPTKDQFRINNKLSRPCKGEGS